MTKNLKHLVATFVAELDEMLRLEISDAVKAALGKQSTKRATNGTPAAAKTVRKTRLTMEKRSPQQLEKMRAKVLAFTARTPGQRSEDIQKALKLATADISLPLRQLLAAKLLRCEGAARGRRYWAMANGAS